MKLAPPGVWTRRPAAPRWLRGRRAARWRLADPDTDDVDVLGVTLTVLVELASRPPRGYGCQADGSAVDGDNVHERVSEQRCLPGQSRAQLLPAKLV